MPPGGLAPPVLGGLTVGPGVTLDRGYGRYVVENRVGEGGMGIVFRGWLFHAPTSPRGGEGPEPVAVKVLRPQMSASPDMRALFLNEADALRRLSHPNVVRFFDLFEHGGSLVLVMEYVDGETLDAVIARHVARAQLAGGGGGQAPGALPGLPFRRAWHYVQQLLGALACLHALGILHRDVKPSNVVLRRDGIVKLTDFGIARLAVTGQTGHLAPGTGAYMSPEQVLAKPLDGRSDLYAAAIVLFECLTGHPPFDPTGKSEFEVRREQVEARPPSIRTLLPQAPPVLDALFVRALAKDPTRRFENALEMGDAFREALGIPTSPEWEALTDLARAAAPASPDEGEGGATRRDLRIATLRDRVLQRFKTARMQGS